jgi:hypothetical protein
MQKVAVPVETINDVFTKCIGNIDVVDLKDRLTLAKSLLENASEEFKTKIASHDLYTIGRNKSTKKNDSFDVSGEKITFNELKSLYTDFFVPSKYTETRSIYDQIIFSAPNRKCPLCGHRIATTIDHYLPKAYYPFLSITPLNLVPSCKDCNTGKLFSYPTRPEDETLHPYFDNVENDLWLHAKVLPFTPPVIKYFVKAPSQWDGLLAARVDSHFTAFKLNELYSIEAAEELANIHYQLSEEFKRKGAAGVKYLLIDASKSKSKNRTNSWQSALYKAIASDDWFCKGGFRLIKK